MKCCCCKCMDKKIKKICSETCKPGQDGKDGITPHIGENNTWWIGNIDTGVIAQGTNGEDGQDGTIPHIDAETGNWFIGETDTGIHAQGEKGDKGDPGQSGADDIISFQAQSQNNAGIAVSRIPFDTIISDNSNGIIEIDADNYIIFNELGIYKIDWQLSYEDPNLGDGDLQVLYAVNNGPYVYSSYRSNMGYISGSIVINTHLAEVLPLYTSLNFSGIGHNVPLGDTRVQTNITIVRLKK